ncbi:MAG: hypothetical protein RIT24_2014 [Planctomycetota bacterium]|jgi:hypothetical protein
MISERAGQPSPGWTDESDPVTGTGASTMQQLSYGVDR